MGHLRRSLFFFLFHGGYIALHRIVASPHCCGCDAVSSTRCVLPADHCSSGDSPRAAAPPPPGRAEEVIPPPVIKTVILINEIMSFWGQQN